jgi:hypothetical protein
MMTVVRDDMLDNDPYDEELAAAVEAGDWMAEHLKPDRGRGGFARKTLDRAAPGRHGSSGCGGWSIPATANSGAFGTVCRSTRSDSSYRTAVGTVSIGLSLFRASGGYAFGKYRPNQWPFVVVDRLLVTLPACAVELGNGGGARVPVPGLGRRGSRFRSGLATVRRVRGWKWVPPAGLEPATK